MGHAAVIASSRWAIFLLFATGLACGAQSPQRGGPTDDDTSSSDTDVPSDGDAHDDQPGDQDGRGLGAACAGIGDCDSGFCVDGVCCDGLCDGLCRSCNQPALSGVCAPLRFVEDEGCAFSAAGARMCDATGACAAPHVLADINRSGGPTQLTVSASGSVLFEANAPTLGRELWAADTNGAHLVADINDGPGGSTIRDATRLGDLVVFDADDGVTGRELYATDGASAYLVRDIALGSASSMSLSDARRFVSFDGWLYFVADDSGGGTSRQLWRTDGVTAEEIQINAGASAFLDARDPPAVFNGALYFAASASNFPNTRLWHINAGSATPIVTSGVTVEPANPLYSGRRAASGGFVYLTCNSQSSVGSELCRSDGASVQNLIEVIPGGASGPYTDEIVALGGWVYFSSYSSAGFPGDPQIWRTNGTQTAKFTNIGSNGSAAPLRLTPVGDLLFFTARDDTSFGHDLWVTDGSTAGTRKLTTGSVTYDAISMVATADAPAGASLFFTRADLVQGVELWRSNGTLQTTVQLTDFPGEKGSEPTLLAQTSWLFFAVDTPDNGRELAYWHPTLGAHGLIDLEPGPLSSSPSAGVVDPATGDVYFTAARAGVTSLMKIALLDQPAGITRVTDIDFSDGGSQPHAFTQAASGQTYFAADDGVHGSELWMTRGAVGDVALVQDVTTTSSPFGDSLSSDIRAIGALGNQLFMTVAYEGADGFTWHLWATDGAGGNAVPFADEGEGTGLEIGAAARFQAIGSSMFWNAHATLYVSDGSEGGTVPLGPCRVDEGAPSAVLGGVLNGALYYYGGTGDALDSLWRTDGGAPELVFDTYPLHADAIRSFAVRSGVLYFLAKDDSGTDRVWSTDGDPAHTVASFGDASLTLADLVVFADQLWVVTKDLTGTQRLGYLDEAGLGFTSVAQVGVNVPGTFSLTVLGSHLFFVAPSASGGPWNELWFTDGSVDGTAPACTGFGCRAPDALTVIGERLYLQADVGGGSEVVVFP